MIEGLSKVLTMTGEAHNSYTDGTVERWLLPGRTQLTPYH